MGAPSTNETVERLFPTGKEGKFVMTAEKWQNFKDISGIKSMNEFTDYASRIREEPSVLSNVQASPARREIPSDSNQQEEDNDY